MAFQSCQEKNVGGRQATEGLKIVRDHLGIHGSEFAGWDLPVSVGSDPNRDQVGVGLPKFGDYGRDVIHVVGLDAGWLDRQSQGLSRRLSTGSGIRDRHVDLGLLLLEGLRYRRHKFDRTGLAWLESSDRQCGGRKLGEERSGSRQGRRDTLKFLFSSVHEVDAHPNALASFKDQIAVLIQHSGLKQKCRWSALGWYGRRRWNWVHGQCCR